MKAQEEDESGRRNEPVHNAYDLTQALIAKPSFVQSSPFRRQTNKNNSFLFPLTKLYIIPNSLHFHFHFRFSQLSNQKNNVRINVQFLQHRIHT